MRIAIVSDIHANGTAFEAVLRDLRDTAPDLVLHGGDLADGGSSGVDVLDTIRGLGWPGVRGNTDELLTTPEAFESFASGLPHLATIWECTREMAGFSRATLGEDRLTWLRGLPLDLDKQGLALVHASPGNCWRMPGDDAFDKLQASLVVNGHTHVPAIRHARGKVIANSGSVGMPYDGDPRASYLLLDDLKPTIRRVAYDVEREARRLADSALPHAGWVARMLRAAAPQMP